MADLSARCSRPHGINTRGGQATVEGWPNVADEQEARPDLAPPVKSRATNGRRVTGCLARRIWRVNDARWAAVSNGAWQSWRRSSQRQADAQKPKRLDGQGGASEGMAGHGMGTIRAIRRRPEAADGPRTGCKRGPQAVSGAQASAGRRKSRRVCRRPGMVSRFREIGNMRTAVQTPRLRNIGACDPQR